MKTNFPLSPIRVEMKLENSELTRIFTLAGVNLSKEICFLPREGRTRIESSNIIDTSSALPQVQLGEGKLANTIFQKGLKALSLYTGLGLSAGLAIVCPASEPSTAQAADSTAFPAPTVTPEASHLLSQNPIHSARLADGTYLYGQAAQPDQLGQEYLVFAVRQGKLVGAFYMPRSEYSCFYGSVEANQLNLTIVDPYSEQRYQHAIALQEQSPPVAAAEEQTVVNFGLQGYQPISPLSENDRRILSTCVEDYQHEVWN